MPADTYWVNVAMAVHKQQIIIQILIDTRWATVNGGVSSVLVDGKLPARERGKRGTTCGDLRILNVPFGDTAWLIFRFEIEKSLVMSLINL